MQPAAIRVFPSDFRAHLLAIHRINGLLLRERPNGTPADIVERRLHGSEAVVVSRMGVEVASPAIALAHRSGHGTAMETHNEVCSRRQSTVGLLQHIHRELIGFEFHLG